MPEEKLMLPTRNTPATPPHLSPSRPSRPSQANPPSILVRIANSRRTYSVLQAAAFGFLTYISIVAIYRNHSDPWNVAFVVSAYTTLMLFSWCLWAFQKAPADHWARKRRLKVAIWSLAAALNLLFSYRASMMLPFGMGAVVWVMAGITTLAGFYAFFTLDTPANLDGNVKNPIKF